MVENASIRLTCRECGKQFVFTKGEQEFYEAKGLTPPTRCKECRSNKKKQSRLTCTQCGIELRQEVRIYCEYCLKNIQLDCDRKVESSQRAASAAQAKLQVAESGNAELEESLCQMKQLVAELESRVKELTLELEKARQFNDASSWLRPALNSIEERLEALEQAQREISQKMLDMIQTMQEEYGSVSLLQILKRSLIPNRRQSAYSKKGHKDQIAVKVE